MLTIVGTTVVSQPEKAKACLLLTIGAAKIAPTTTTTPPLLSYKHVIETAAKKELDLHYPV